MTAIKARIRDDYINKSGRSKIYLQIFINKRCVKVPTKAETELIHYDYKREVIKLSDPDHERLNLLIAKAKATANNILIKYNLMEKDLSPDLFRKEYKNPTQFYDFYKFMESAIVERKGLVDEKTIIQNYTILNKLREFKKTLIFSELTPDFLSQFERHLKITLKNGINTRHCALKIIKVYSNIAIERGYIEKNPFKSFKLKRGKSRIIYLSNKELKRLIKFYKHSEEIRESHKRVLRHFLFQCMTGLRISDLKSLTYEMIISKSIYKTPRKTRNINNQMIIIPLNKFALRLIKDENQFKINGIIFDTISEQKMNKHLKEIAKDVKIEKNITTHIGRHTFATLFYEATNDIATLQKLLGHSNIAQTIVYAHISEEKKKEQIKKFEGYFN